MRPKGQKNPSLVQSSFYFKNDTQNKKKNFEGTWLFNV